jgi:hypothetical protein
LNFQTAITEQPVYRLTDANVIGIYVATPFRKEVTQSEVVSLHGRVIAKMKSAQVALTKMQANESARCSLVEQTVNKAVYLPAGPRRNTLFDIGRQFVYVMPKLDNDSRYRLP